MWNWQSKKWPNFQIDREKLTHSEKLFVEGAGVVAGAARHLPSDDYQWVLVELMSGEALDTSEIEGELLNRESVQSSIRRELGLTTSKHHATAAESGVAEMMVSLYQTLNTPLQASVIFDWHRMLMSGRRDLDHVGAYRRHSEAMQIVSGPDYRRKVHYEAPPSTRVPKEMTAFLKWFSESSPSGKNPLPTVMRAGIAHLWFESIHPFEDGNGRIGRAIAEKALAEGFSSPTLTVLAKVLLKRRKEYYSALNQASKTLEITPWLLWFAAAAIEAQRTTLAHVDFIIEKTKLMDRVLGQLNARQEKVLLRMFQAGPNGFEGGMSAEKYRHITRTTTATTTRDLRDLVKKSVFIKKGSLKSARYFLLIDSHPVATVTVEDIL